MTELDVGEKFYDYALEWDKIPQTSFKKMNMTITYTSPLKVRSEARTKTEPEFVELGGFCIV
jgi:carboxyl-terminal processing protease